MSRRRRATKRPLVDDAKFHSPLVTRWLKAYAIYDTDQKAIIRVTITIQGELQE